MERTPKILVVDDEPEIRNLLCILLRSNGFVAIPAENGRVAVTLASEIPDFDLILLDIMMPHLSGIEACAEIRRFSKAPVLFLTAKTTEKDKSEAYASGGDDFLAKPFSQAELLMKVRSLLRRYYEYRGKEAPEREAIVLGNVTVDPVTRRVHKNGETVDLTEKEYEVLFYLCKHRGQPVDALTIYEDVWREKYLETSGNTVMVHIVRLRKKIEDPADTRLIRTIYGKGYILD